MSTLQKRSISLHAHRTSIALEPEFWIVLENMARQNSCPLASLVARIDSKRDPAHGLASCLRIAALRHLARERDFRLPARHAKNKTDRAPVK